MTYTLLSSVLGVSIFWCVVGIVLPFCMPPSPSRGCVPVVVRVEVELCPNRTVVNGRIYDCYIFIKCGWLHY